MSELKNGNRKGCKDVERIQRLDPTRTIHLL